jgi:hypothetical protein
MAIASNISVITLDYWKRADQVRVGDYLFNKDGKPVQVTSVQTYMSEDCYRITFDDGLAFVADKHLGMLLENRHYRKVLRRYTGAYKRRAKLKFVKLDNIVGETIKHKTGRSLYSIPTTEPIQFPHQTLPVPPFIFGFWFVNRKANRKFTAYSPYIDTVYAKFKDYGYKIVQGSKRLGHETFREFPVIETQLSHNIPIRIPANYLMASADERWELLAGILHGRHNSYDPKTDRFRFSNKNKAIVMQVQNLAESLGNKTTMSLTKGQTPYYNLEFKTHKVLVSNQVSPPLKVHNAHRFIRSIKPVTPQMVTHIETSDPENNFLMGEGYISVC